MLPAESKITPMRRNAVDAKELEYIAFSGQHEIAHGIFRSIPKSERASYANKYVLSEVIAGGVKKLKTYLAASAEVAAQDEKEFIDAVVELFIHSARSASSFPRELFESLLLWSDELKRLSLLNESLRYYDEVIALGVNKFPDLYVRSLVGKAGVLNTLGKFRETQSLLASLAERPYVITERNVIPELLFNLGKESLLKGDISFYKQLLFRGLGHFYSNIENRRVFVDQIRKTYRHSHNVAFDSSVSFADKISFFIHRLYFIVQQFAIARYVGVVRAVRLAVLGYVYATNYFLRSTRTELVNRNDRVRVMALSRRRNILITRAMGGIGDLLMMTPAFHALKKKYPKDEIHLAIPKRYFSLFEHNDDVTPVDIENTTFNHYGYKKWFNFTDCPAARIESLTAPKVKRSRIELFGRAVGLNLFTLKKMHKQPRYVVSSEERAFQEKFWRVNGLNGKKVIGVQLHSDEVYRDYPHMRPLVAALASEYHVMVFDVENIAGFDDERIVKVEGLPMRRAFALVAACDAIVAPDSAFVHLAAAFTIPTVALYGPVDGKLRTMHYPNCVYLDVRKKLGCMPCWRNDKIPCRLTNMRTSVCMADISVQEICSTLNQLLAKAPIT